ncbi:MAG: hypothetical protein JF628_14385 [Sphingomonas sp.]|nr:hypothetical protein [Sphingomonas sp.]
MSMPPQTIPQPACDRGRGNAGGIVDPEDIIEPVVQYRPTCRRAGNDLALAVEPDQAFAGRLHDRYFVRPFADLADRDPPIIVAAMAADEQANSRNKDRGRFHRSSLGCSNGKGQARENRQA